MLLLTLLKASIAVLILSIGMSATIDDLTFLWRRPILLLKSTVAMYVVIPVVVVLMTRLLSLPPKTELALMVLAICAGAPLLPKKLIKFGGDPAFVFSLVATTSVFAVVTVPASLYLLENFIHIDSAMATPVQVAHVIFKSFLLPLGLGMAIRWALPERSERIGDLLMKIAGTAMALAGLVILAVGLRLVVAVGLPTILAFGGFALAAIVIGHLFGGPDELNRTSMAVACASRHIGLALLIAAHAPGRETLALVVAYLLASAIVSILYVRWMMKRRADGKRTGSSVRQ
jgi:BASS family bile acid:Na+ symporter